MPRRRTPSPEQQKQDQQIAFGILHVLTPLKERYPGDPQLLVAAEMIERFQAREIVTPKKKRQARAKPSSVDTTVPLLDSEAEA